MLKVTKFGGSSMADAGQYRKIRDIVAADRGRRVVVVSAAGKRFKDDHKITDLLYLCHAHTQYGVDCSGIFEMIASRYLQIRDDLGIQLDLETEFAALKQRIEKLHKCRNNNRRIPAFRSQLPLIQFIAIGGAQDIGMVFQNNSVVLQKVSNNSSILLQNR